MVNMDRVQERLLKGAYVGVGSFASNFTASFIEDNLPVGDMGTSAVQVGTGLALSVGVDEVFENPRSAPNDLVEFAGYGIQGAGFADLADSIQAGNGSETGQMVSVERRSPSQQAGQRVRTVTQEDTETESPADFAADVA